MEGTHEPTREDKALCANVQRMELLGFEVASAVIADAKQAMSKNTNMAILASIGLSAMVAARGLLSLR